MRGDNDLTNPFAPKTAGDSLSAVDADQTSSGAADAWERSPQNHNSEVDDAASSAEDEYKGKPPTKRPDSDAEPHAAAWALLVRAVGALRERGRRPTSAGVKSEMKTLSPWFDETKMGFDSFRMFLTAAEREDVISLSPAPSGPDVLVGLSAKLPGRDEGPDHEPESLQSAPRPPGRIRIRPDLWKAFVDWDPGLLRAIERDTHEIVLISRVPKEFEPDSVAALRHRMIVAPERFLPIEPISPEQQVAWMNQFAQSIEEECSEKDNLLNALKENKPATVFARTIRTMPPLNQEWYGRLAENVSEVINGWLAQHNIRLNIFDGARTITDSALRAREERGRTPQPARQGTRLDDLRGEILAMLAHLPTEELMQIRVPALYLLRR